MRSCLMIMLLLLATQPPTSMAGEVYVINSGAKNTVKPIDLTPNTTGQATSQRELERQMAELQYKLLLMETKLERANKLLAEQQGKSDPEPEKQIVLEPVKTVEIPTKVCQCMGSNRGVCLCLQTGTRCSCSSRAGRVYKVNDNGSLTATSKKSNPNRKPEPITVNMPEKLIVDVTKPLEKKETSQATSVENPQGYVTTRNGRHYFKSGDGGNWHTDSSLHSMIDTQYSGNQSSPKPVKVQRVYTGCANGSCRSSKSSGFLGGLFGN